jgi:regulator of nucleoside diphosphate kinase
MQKIKKRLILTKEDFQIIMHYLKGTAGKFSFNQHEANEMEQELKKAKLISETKFPEDVVKLNSFVTIKDEDAGKIMKVTVVPPVRADIKKMMISVMSPIGTALIGYQKGEQVSWKVPAGRKTFTILDVQNSFP